ncbi:Z1 domain-containing protein [Clostridium diolis]|uniref:Endonuclease n=1 Tax=Clostridium diolis TaxID=223919 RepID=A0AAV3VYP8_9CLOT|nr:Z1 domain-containing protein [Clostridium diolis]QES75847.1 endonuclease [Clostridium diolis]GEA30322.1 endonuclease [Clostridium diolis]
MNDLCNQLYNLLISTIVDEDIQDEKDIDENIEQFRMLPKFKSISEEDIVKIRNRIKSERSIKLNLGSLLESEEKYEKWFLKAKSELDMQYWERYKKYLLQDQHFAVTVVNTMDVMLDTLTDLLGNPNLEGHFQRRGLIIGDVQSGKTSNYTGLICKAADSGYKVIVLLTGTIEKLRKQTQLRMDEGFVGMDSAAMIKKKPNNIIGVGKYDPSIHPMVLTSTMNDFKKTIANNLGFNLKTINQPVIFVMKKNVSSLNNLNEWLRTLNQKESTDIIDTSLLVVDDESDNASVNTNPEDKDPTSINCQIRNLLGLFKRASYVGFTATPFANIFIDPDTNDEMLKEDLFPKDYIYSLDAPSNYIGARNIFSDAGKHTEMLVKINGKDIEKCLPSNHKGDYVVTYIPDDLKQAINSFLIANVIRDLRGDINKHRSMLINISRFTNVQEQLGNIVNDYLKEMQSAARVYGKMTVNEALLDKNISSLHETYNQTYSNIEFEWDIIQRNLYKSIVPVVVAVVNQKHKNGLNYEEYESDGLRAIAVGGLSLSRGLTLEGLVISYFYRNSKMYDTLMQMGRWFGYRKNYEDLCRIWMSDESIEWYEHISMATDELRREVKRYENSGLTPKDFGLRVRSDINSLIVTARNKMRTASSMVVSIALSGEVIETPNIFNSVNKNDNNLNTINNFKKDMKQEKIVKYGKKNYGYKDVKKENIINLIKKFEISLLNNAFDVESVTEFLQQYEGNELDKWDVVFLSGESGKTYKIDHSIETHLVERSFSVEKDGKILRMSGKKNRLGSAGDGRYGLSDLQIEEVKKLHSMESDGKKSISQKYYFQSVNRKPLLLIYMISLKDATGENSEIIEKFNNTPLVGLGMGIPKLKNSSTKFAKYTINKIQQELLNDYDIGEEE